MTPLPQIRIEPKGFEDGADVPQLLVQSLPAELARREERLAAIRQAKARIEVRLPEELGRVAQLLADNGYFSAANVAACVTAKIEPLLASFRCLLYLILWLPGLLLAARLVAVRDPVGRAGLRRVHDRRAGRALDPPLFRGEGVGDAASPRQVRNRGCRRVGAVRLRLCAENIRVAVRVVGNGCWDRRFVAAAMEVPARSTFDWAQVSEGHRGKRTSSVMTCVQVCQKGTRGRNVL
jgi:hypothetical protein